jgi:hypothetical protein
LATRDDIGYGAGFLTATGLLTMSLFLTWAVHFRSPFGGTFGLGGAVGILGGALVLVSGLLLRRTH